MAGRSRELRVVISGDATNLNKAFNQAGRDAEQAQGKVHKFGLNIGSAFKAAGAAIAASAVVDQVKESVKAAEAAQVAQAKLATQLKAVGVSYGAHAKQITEVIDKTSALSGISGKDLEGALTSVVRGTGSLKDGLHGVSIAADLARAKHMDVAKAGDLVAKVYEGNVGALKRMGIALTPVTTAQDKLKESTKKATVEQTRAAKEADKTATAHKALGLLQQRVGGQAAAYGKTAAGAQDRFRVAVEHLHEKIGGALLPVLTQVADKAAKFVDQLTSGTGAGGRFAAKLKDVADAVKPIVKFFTDHPKLIALAVGAWGAYKAAGVAAATITRGKIIASFLGLSRKAAVGGAEAGASFGGAASAEASTKMRGFGWSGLGGKIGTVLGVAAGAAAAVEVANALSKTDFVQGIADKLGSALGIIDPKPVRDARDRRNNAQWHRNRTTTVGAGTTGPTISLPQVAAGHHSGVVTHHPTPAPHPGTRAHGAVAHTAAAVGDPSPPVQTVGQWYADHDRPMPGGIRVNVPQFHSVRKGRLHTVRSHGHGVHRGGLEPKSPQAHLASVGAPVAHAAGGALSFQQLEALWIQAGGDPKMARLMAHVAMAESGGNPGARNPSGATGLWQILGNPFPGDATDPLTNARMAVAKYKSQGLGAWAASQGAWGRFSSERGMAPTAGATHATTVHAPTGADYARNAAHRVAPITNAFDHASGIYGGQAARASSAVDTYDHSIGTAQRIADRRPVDLNTIPGRMQRTFDLLGVRRGQAAKLAAQRRQVTAKKHQITLKRQEITRLMAAMHHGSKHQRPAIRAKIHKLQGDIRQLKADIRQLGFDIEDSRQDVADTDSDIATVQAGPQDPPDKLTGTAAIPGADAYLGVIDEHAALAALTPGTGDDLAAAQEGVTAWQSILGYEQAHPDQFTPGDIADAARNLKGAQDNVTQLGGGSDAVDANTQALKDLRDEIKRQNDFSTSVANVTSREAVRALADIISGQITGTGYDPRAMTAGAGALARY